VKAGGSFCPSEYSVFAARTDASPRTTGPFADWLLVQSFRPPK